MNSRVLELNKIIKDAIGELQIIQNECSHPESDLTVKQAGHHSYDSHDEAWADYHCRLCDKKWTDWI